MEFPSSGKGAIIALIIFAILSFVLPFQVIVLDQIFWTLSYATFLFGIFAGFVIASRLTRYTRFRDLLTNETGNLIAIYEHAKLIDERFARKTADLIDKYILEGFLYGANEYHKQTEASFYNIFREMNDITPKNPQQENALRAMMYIWREMPKDREELYLLAKDKVGILLKSILIILSGIVIFNLFYIRTDVLYSHLITVLLSTSIILVLFLIRDLDRLKLSDAAMSYGIYFRIFDLMGKPRVYTNWAVKHGYLELPKKFAYRYGLIATDSEGKNYYKKIVSVNPLKKKRS